jgi:alanyl-tRNA synthetase
MEQVRQQTDRIIAKIGECVIVLGCRENDKAVLRVVVTHSLTKKLHAGNLIKEIVAVVGGRGGGKPEKAEAGGPNVERLGDALALARQRVMEALTAS